jgi:hypothetical protein
MSAHHYTETHCEMCRRRFLNDEAVVEMFDPDDPHAVGSLIVHTRCGLARGWQEV